jgi:hypothetical protein
MKPYLILSDCLLVIEEVRAERLLLREEHFQQSSRVVYLTYRATAAHHGSHGGCPAETDCNL